MFLCFIQPYGTGVSENQAGPAVFPNSAVVAQEGMVDVVLLTGRKEQYAEPSDVVDEMILRWDANLTQGLEGGYVYDVVLIGEELEFVFV